MKTFIADYMTNNNGESVKEYTEIKAKDREEAIHLLLEKDGIERIIDVYEADEEPILEEPIEEE